MTPQDPLLSARPLPHFTSFDGPQRIAAGTLAVNALAVHQALARGARGPILTVDDHSGDSVELDTRGSAAEVLARLAHHPANRSAQPPEGHAADHPAASGRAQEADTGSASDGATGPAAAAEGAARGRGRPRLGVVPREVTLLPRHWDWLAEQPGGASVTLRRLVEQARKAGADQARIRQRQARAHRFMTVAAGHLPGYEEALRALYAGDAAGLDAQTQAWPPDLRTHARWLASAAADAPLPDAATGLEAGQGC